MALTYVKKETPTSSKISGTDGSVADVKTLTNSNALATVIVDANGTQITTLGGGTEYTEGAVDPTFTGSVVMMEVSGNTARPLQGSVTDGLLVNLGSNNDVTIEELPLPFGAATSVKQDTIIGHIDGIETLLTSLNDKTDGSLTLRMATVGSITYIGKANIGSATSSASWQVKRIDETSGLVAMWADGNSNFDNIWDNRASLSYS